MEWWQAAVSIIVAALASNGLWAYLQKKAEKKDVRTLMLTGLAHDRIMYLGMQYVKRGCISRDEYENLHNYLYEPYIAMGGNGAAKKVMAEVDKLPLVEPDELVKKGA